MEVFKAKAEDRPEWHVVEPDQSATDPESCLAVVPGGRAEETAEEVAARVLDTEGADSIHRSAERSWPMPQPVVYGLEQRLREPVERDVQETARAPPARVQPDEERIDRPTRQPVHEETLARGQAATLLARRIAEHHPAFYSHGRPGAKGGKSTSTPPTRTTEDEPRFSGRYGSRAARSNPAPVP